MGPLDRWAMLRNPAYGGQAAFGKTKTADHRAPTLTTRARAERHGRRPTRYDQPGEKWTLIAVPALVSEQTFELAQARLEDNKRFSRRNTKDLTLLQSVLVCRESGYSCYRTCTRTSNKRISGYGCIGQDGLRYVGGRVCGSHPVPADVLDQLVWGEVRRLLEDPRSYTRRSTVGSKRWHRAPREQAPRDARARPRQRRECNRASDRGIPGTAHLDAQALRPQFTAWTDGDLNS